MTTNYDIIIVGGGPIGIACALEARKAGLSYLILEKGCLVNSLYNYPANMTFFSTSERIEIGGVPFVSNNVKPNRSEALEYYRRVAVSNHLNIHLQEAVVDIRHLSHHVSSHHRHPHLSRRQRHPRYRLLRYPGPDGHARAKTSPRSRTIIRSRISLPCRKWLSSVPAIPRWTPPSRPGEKAPKSPWSSAAKASVRGSNTGSNPISKTG